MALGFNSREYKSWEEIDLDASLERRGDDLLAIRLFGRSASLAADTPAALWSVGGYMTLLTTARILSIVSTSTADDLGSTGANYVQISGLDSNFNIITETVAMDGTTPVLTTQSFLRVNRARVVTAGTGRTNAGTITATAQVDSAIQFQIEIGDSISQSTYFTVPAGYSLYTASIVLTTYRPAGGSATARAAEVDVVVYVPSITTTYQSVRYGIRADGGLLMTNPSYRSQTPEKCTIFLDADADIANTVVAASTAYILIKGDFNTRTEW
jgi:hypothetical protein